MAACVCFEMLVGCAPFYHEDMAETANKIENEELRLPKFVSKDAADLLHLMLVKDKEKRMKTIRLALISPWITRYATKEENDQALQAIRGFS
jgi:serine/threonine protein kinase